MVHTPVGRTDFCPPRGNAGGMPSRPGVRLAARLEARALLPSPLPYPDDLPITGRKEDILAALVANQVVIVAGETGSGKSTQLPKMCLEAGRGSAGMIGHTQPRRIAARSIAERVADELGVALGALVGYKVRFTDRVGDGTLVKVMTDGVLLAELHSDPGLHNYDTIIVDEAHERSLNIDFILGYLKRLLPSRPDLRVIITSATIDTERFSDHFDGAPVIEVSGHVYPVELRYQPMTQDAATDDDGALDEGGDPEAPDEVQAVCDAVGELYTEAPGRHLGFSARGKGDPGHRGHAGEDGLERPRSPVPVRAAQLRRAAPDLRTARRAPSCSIDKRRGDFSHRPGDPLRRRSRDGSHLSLQPADQGPAASHRARFAGVCQPAGGTLRPARPRHLRTALLRAGFRGAPPFSPSRRYCGQIWRPWCCRWRRSASERSKTSPSSTHLTGATSKTE